MIFWYSGRILSVDEISVVGEMTQIMKDLSVATFSVSVLDKFSPVAYSIVNEIHWHHKVAKHSGVETIWREVLKKMFIIKVEV